MADRRARDTLFHKSYRLCFCLPLPRFPSVCRERDECGGTLSKKHDTPNQLGFKEDRSSIAWLDRLRELGTDLRACESVDRESS